MSAYTGETHVMRRAEPQKTADKNWQRWIQPGMAAVCQGFSVVIWVGIMHSLTPRMELAIPYAILFGLGLGTILSFGFSKSAWTAKAVDILMKTYGGALVLVLSVLMFAVVYLVQPLLAKDGLTAFQSIAVTLLAQMPMATFASVMSTSFLLRVFNETHYKRAMDAMIREMRAKRRIEHAQIIRTAVKDLLEVSAGKPIEGQLRDILATADLKISNMTTMVTLLCEKSPTYAPPQYHKLLSQVLEETKAKLTDAAVASLPEPAEAVVDPIDYLFRGLEVS